MDFPLDGLAEVDPALPVALNNSRPAVTVTGRKSTSVPENVVVVTPGKSALCPPALVTHTAVVACELTLQLKLKLKSSPGGVMLA